ncbi:MAG: hypothetical protein ACK559_26435, partial [bacterium]
VGPGLAVGGRAHQHGDVAALLEQILEAGPGEERVDGEAAGAGRGSELAVVDARDVAGPADEDALADDLEAAADEATLESPQQRHKAAQLGRQLLHAAQEHGEGPDPRPPRLGTQGARTDVGADAPV